MRSTDERNMMTIEEQLKWGKTVKELIYDLQQIKDQDAYVTVDIDGNEYCIDCYQVPTGELGYLGYKIILSNYPIAPPKCINYSKLIIPN